MLNPFLFFYEWHPNILRKFVKEVNGSLDQPACLFAVELLSQSSYLLVFLFNSLFDRASVGKKLKQVA